MESSWLVQRLLAPAKQDNPFSFGGGYKNGGLSDDAMDKLRDIWSFDYMGSAEFEFGAVPEALSKLANRKLVATAVPSLALYAICAEKDKDDVLERIASWLGAEPKLKEGLAFWNERVLGWLELDNGFLFFRDEVMFKKTCELFGVAEEAVK